jgi:hypothetical protein
MKIITLSKIGYNAPAQTNWCYGIWKIDTIDTNEKYQMSYVVKENFGGDYRLKEQIPEIIETKGVYTSTGTQKITGIAGLQNMEDEKFINMLKEWLKA